MININQQSINIDIIFSVIFYVSVNDGYIDYKSYKYSDCVCVSVCINFADSNRFIECMKNFIAQRNISDDDDDDLKFALQRVYDARNSEAIKFLIEHGTNVGKAFVSCHIRW